MKSTQRSWFWLGGLVALLVFFTIFSSSLPDGLEWVAHRLGFQEREASAPVALFSDYTISQHLPAALNQILSALLGSLLLAGILFLLFRWQSCRNPDRKQNHEA